MVQYLEAKVAVPMPLLSDWSEGRGNDNRLPEPTELNAYETQSFQNAHQTYRSFGFEPGSQYQPPYHFPVLPGMTYKLGSIGLTDNVGRVDWGESVVRWMVAGDIVPMRQGEVLIKDLLTGAVNASELPS